MLKVRATKLSQSPPLLLQYLLFTCAAHQANHAIVSVERAELHNPCFCLWSRARYCWTRASFGWFTRGSRVFLFCSGWSRFQLSNSYYRGWGFRVFLLWSHCSYWELKWVRCVYLGSRAFLFCFHCSCRHLEWVCGACLGSRAFSFCSHWRLECFWHIFFCFALVALVGFLSVLWRII